jgi:hypothetical protein
MDLPAALQQGALALELALRRPKPLALKIARNVNELLLRNQPKPLNFQESIIGCVQAYTAGYKHDLSKPRDSGLPFTDPPNCRDRFEGCYLPDSRAGRD